MFTAIISGYRFLYLSLASLIGYGWAIVALSFICSALMLPLMRAVAGIVNREKEYESVIDPQIAAIKRTYATDMDRHFHIQSLYVRYAYSPLAPIKKVLPLFVQIPFLLLTYYMLKGTAELSGVPFLFLSNLGTPDNLISLPLHSPTPTLHSNLLPLLMTAVNILTVFATPGFTHKDWTQAIAISLLFLALLYTAPSALLLYWTLNNTITFVRTLCEKRFAGAKVLYHNILNLMRMISRFYKLFTWQNSIIISLALFLLALYLFVTADSLSILNMSNPIIEDQCQIGMLICLALATVLLYSFLARNNDITLRPVYWSCVVLFCIAIIVLFMIRIISQNVFYSVKTYLNKLMIFEFLTAFYVVPLLVRKKLAYQGFPIHVFSAIKSDWILLLLPLAFGIHYSFSSTNITLSAVSIVYLCLYMIVPLIIASLILGAMFFKIASFTVILRASLGVGIGIYIIPLVSTEHGFFCFDRNLLIRLIIVVVSTLTVVLFRKRRMLHVFVVCLLVSVGFNSFRITQAKAKAEGPQNTMAIKEKLTESALNGVKCNKKRNVALLVYDAYECPYVLKTLGIMDPDLEPYLKKHGYTLYNAYSAGYHTLSSMSAAFTIGGVQGGNQRSTVAGDNPYCDFLKANGYTTSFMLCGYTMPKEGDRLPGDFYFPKSSRTVPKEKILYSCILRGILSQSPSVFNAYTAAEWLEVKRDLVSKSSGVSNSFIYAHFSLPGHANYDPRYRATDEEIVREFVPRMNEANKVIKTDVEMYDKNHEDDIVILASDHGAYLRIPKVIDQPDALDLLDRFGVFLAVRWPRGYTPTLNITCLNDVILETVICLTGDKSLSRLQTECVTDPLPSPAACQAGMIRNGVIQYGINAGKPVFSTKKGDQ